MDSLAAHCSADPERWAPLGLLAHLDDEYAEHNPSVRGATAADEAELEGLHPALCAVLRDWREPARWSAFADAPTLPAALAFSDAILRWLEQREEREEDVLQQAELTAALARELELARANGDDDGERLDAALELLGATETLAATAVGALRSQAEARP